ncbi:guanylate cyclase [Pycnococcus provasolii]
MEIERSGCYKVETIGDSVMVVGGAFGANLHEQHRELVRLATRLLECIALLRAPDGTPLQIRAGIHTGTAIGGVVGLRQCRGSPLWVTRSTRRAGWRAQAYQ